MRQMYSSFYYVDVSIKTKRTISENNHQHPVSLNTQSAATCSDNRSPELAIK